MNILEEVVPFRVADLADRKARGVPIVMATAYDYVAASAVDAAGVDVVLVGDSAATVVLGLPVTRDVTLEEMLMLTRAARRGVRRGMLLGDLPFGSYEASDEQAIATARRFADIGCDAVKMEGGGSIVARARAVVAAGIPVVGHLGLEPQKLVAGQSARAQARSADDAFALIHDAKALEDAGCCALVLEAVPAAVSERAVPRLTIPVIGIGAGSAPDGQVLVTYDLAGLTDGHIPRFVKRYAELKQDLVRAVASYADDVRGHRFPETRHEYGIDSAELTELDRRLGTS